MLPECSAFGHERAAVLVREARDEGRGDELRFALDQLLRDPDWRAAWLGAVFCRVGEARPSSVERARAQVDAWPATPAQGPVGVAARDDIRGLWHRYIAAGNLPWRREYRALLDHPDHLQGLLGAALVFDRHHALSILPAILARSEHPVPTFAFGIVSACRRAEAEAIREALVGRSELPGGLLEAIDWYLTHDKLERGPDRGEESG